MAVQAQYPSNVLLFDRNVQESNDYSLQPQLGTYLDQSQFNSNGVSNNNPRKRGRDFSSPVPIDMFSQINNQSHSQLVNLSQLHNHNHQHQLHQQQLQNAVSTGLRLSFGDQQQLQHQQQQQSIYNNHTPSLLSSQFNENLANQIKHQKEEIDQFLQTQGEHLRRTLTEKRQRHYRALLGSAEELVARRLREREAEAQKSARRNAELEARAAQLNMEAQFWQARARAHEITAANLQAQLQEAIVSGECARDGPTCADDSESAYIDPDRVISNIGPKCKSCGTRAASVVLLPCRHFCVCTECDGFLQACPLCLTTRNSSVQIFTS